MGRPKWLEPVGGIPMALRATAALTPHVREVVLLAPDQDSGALGLPVVADAAGGGGPLAGLVAALEYAVASGDRGVLALACDLPLVDSGLLGALVSFWAGEDIVAPEHAGRIQPLCAVWSVTALPLARVALASADRSPLNLSQRLRVRSVSEADWRDFAGSVEPLLNVNAPDDLTRAEEILVGLIPRSSRASPQR
jgi:molybdopterin-guanine dinucleotide biosynthesis protein A